MLFSVDKKVVWQLLQSCCCEKAVKVYVARGLTRGTAKEKYSLQGESGKIHVLDCLVSCRGNQLQTTYTENRHALTDY